jgi:hypothetical protein
VLNAIRRGQDQPDECTSYVVPRFGGDGKLVGQEIKRGVVHHTPTLQRINRGWGDCMGVAPTHYRGARNGK